MQTTSVISLRRDNIQEIAALTGEDPYLLELEYYQAAKEAKTVLYYIQINKVRADAQHIPKECT